MNKKIRLHIGCGSQIKDGYINIDEFNPKADLRKSILDLDFNGNSITTIEGYMVFEHLSFFEAQQFLAKAYNMLKRGGNIIVEIPDIEKVARLIICFSDNAYFINNGAFGLRGIFGAPLTKMTIGDYHKWGYSPTSAKWIFENAGFTKIRISDGYSHCYPLRDMRIEATK
jgi:hypothetical protein